MGSESDIAQIRADIKNAIQWQKMHGGSGQALHSVRDAEARVNAFLAQVEADRKQAESVLASFNLARHALASIYEMVNLGDPGRNPEVLMRIEYAVEEAMTQAEKQTAN